MKLKNAGFFKRFLFLAVSLILVSCVTVNVHFPEGAVQKAADDYVKELYRAKEKAKDEESAKTSFVHSPTLNLLSSVTFGHVAHAQGVFKTDSAVAKKIMSQQASRLSRIDKFKKSGDLGESDNGLLAIKDESKLKKLQLKVVKKLVDEENADREAFYSEVTNINNLPAPQVNQMRTIFHKSFVSASPAGTWVQAGGSWSQK